MPEDTFDQSLEQLMGYPVPPQTESAEFVAAVMKQVRQEQRTRKLILFTFRPDRRPVWPGRRLDSF